MSFKFQHVRELQRRVRELWPALSASEFEEVTQEILQRALQADPSLGESADALTTAALTYLPKVRAEACENQRRGHKVARDDGHAGRAGSTEAEPVLEPRRRSRPPHLPAVPKGRVRAWFPTGAVDHIESGVGDLPSADERTAAQQLIEMLGRVQRGEPMLRESLDGIMALHRELIGHEPKETWARLLADEISEVARRRVNDAAEKARRPAFAREPPPDGMTLRLSRLPAALKVDPTTPEVIDVQVQPVLVAVRGQLVVFALVGELWGRRQVLGWAQGSFVQGEPVLPPSFDLVSAAKMALVNAVGKVAAIPGGHGLPEWALDVRLIQILIGRMGFEGSGGASRKLAKKTIVRLLANPSELADELERYGACASTRVTDGIEQDLSDLIVRLRAA